MPLTIAAIQMYAAPFAVAENLGRASVLVAAAVAQGAQLVLLPELFNTGYSYSADMFDYAEPRDGVTATWMRKGAANLGCVLAGGFLERSGDSAYSTLLLAAPDGGAWFYRKRHLFFWERGLCRAGSEPVVANTALGRIGLLLGADIAYDDSATAYANTADLLLVASTAALLPDGTVYYPSGRSISMGRFLPAFAGRAAQMRYDYYEGVGQRAAALAIPVAHAVQCGTFASPLPTERMGLLRALKEQPRTLALRLRRKRARVQATFFGHSAIWSHEGTLLAVQPDDEGVVLAHCLLAGEQAANASSAGMVQYGTTVAR